MYKSVFAIAAAVTLGLAASQAAAEQPLAAPAETVATSNVNFRDEAAVKAFYARIEAAAHKVCDSNSANPRVTQRDALCARQAVAQAVRAADRPLLTALYDTSRQGLATR